MESQHTSQKTNAIKPNPSRVLYDVNYVIDIDSHVISGRQSQHYVGHFYNKMIKSRILKSRHPSPILKQEEKVKAMRRYRSPAVPNKQDKDDDSCYYFRSKSFLNASRFPPLSPR